MPEQGPPKPAGSQPPPAGKEPAKQQRGDAHVTMQPDAQAHGKQPPASAQQRRPPPPVVARIIQVARSRPGELLDPERVWPALVSQFGREEVDKHKSAIETVVARHNQRIAPPNPVPADKWPKLEESVACAGCRREFGVITWKHRCEQCGEVYCSTCCHRTKEIIGKETPAPVCDGCYSILERRALPLGVRRSQSVGPGVATRALSAVGGAIGLTKSAPAKRSSGDGGRSGIKPKHKAKAGPTDLASLILEDEGDRFAYACLVAAFLSDERVPKGTDPEGKWRDAEFDGLIEALDLGKRKAAIAAAIDGDNFNPLPLIAQFRRGAAAAPAMLECYLKITAWTGVYDSRSRTLLGNLALLVGVSRFQLTRIESTLAAAVLEIAERTPDEVLEEIEKQKRKALMSRRVKIGLGTVVGGVLIGVTAGLAAPLVAVGATAAFGASAGAALAGTTGAAALGTLFGARGANLLAHKTMRRYGDLTEFEFVKLGDDDANDLSVVINVPGWVMSDPAAVLIGGKTRSDEYVAKDFVVPVAVEDAAGEAYTVVWESEKLYALSAALSAFARKKVFSEATSQVIKQTAMAAVMAALAVPSALMTASDLVDNPWGVCVEAANAAGVELANVLLGRVQGSRPVTLVGYSMGALTIACALREMARRSHCRGIVQSVYLFGAPATGQSAFWNVAATVVADKIVNFRSTNDWFLKLMLRGLQVEACVAGLEGINHPRATNIDVSAMVVQHSDWATKMPKLLQFTGLSTVYSRTPFHSNVGDRVRVRGKGEGILRFYGWLNDLEPTVHMHSTAAAGVAVLTGRPEFFGIALDKPLGNSDGSLKYGRYFECDPGHGVFLPAEAGDVELIEGMYVKPTSCYSPSCRKNRSDNAGAADDAPPPPCGCYSAACRVDVVGVGLARLVPRPDDEAMIKDDATKRESSWGLGRLLAAKRDEAACAAEGKDAKWPTVTPEALANGRVRFTNCDSSLVSAAVYTVVLSAADSDSTTDTVADWSVQRTHAQLQTLHSLLIVELGKDYGKVEFPDGMFTTAAGRTPLLQAWLQDAVRQLPRLRLQALERAFFLLDVKLDAGSRGEEAGAPAPPPAKASGGGAGADAAAAAKK